MRLPGLDVGCAVKVLVAVVVLFCCAFTDGISLAGAFDQAEQDFTFRYTVNGYDGKTWFGEPTSLALNERSGLIYVSDAKTGTVDAFSRQGIPRFRYGLKQGLESPLALAVDSKGDVYVAENRGGPIKIIGAKEEVSTLELPAVEGKDLPKPGRMCFDQDGNLYVVDRANNQIVVFDKQRKIKFRIVALESDQYKFKLLQDVAVDRQGRIYALDSIGPPVQVFDRNGKYMYRFGLHGEGEQDLAFPSALFLDRNDQVWIVDRAQHGLKVFDRTGIFLRRFGSYGLGEGMLFHPVDADMDSFGYVFVLEIGSRRMQVFALARPFEPLRPAGL
jgi:DNA-binding beta-propeller fold protein YncE